MQAARYEWCTQNSEFRRSDNLATDCQNLGQWLDQHRFSEELWDLHLGPVTGAIWSSPIARSKDLPLTTFLNFFENHGLLSISQRPQWRTVCGGSRSYVEKLMQRIRTRARELHGQHGTNQREAVDFLRTSHVVETITKEADPNGWTLTTSVDGKPVRLKADQVVPAGGSTPCVPPTHKRSRSASLFPRMGEGEKCTCEVFGFHQLRRTQAPVSITYWLDHLQGLTSSKEGPLLLSLNPHREPAVAKVIQECTFEHPILDESAWQAQSILTASSGFSGLWFAGA